MSGFMGKLVDPVGAIIKDKPKASAPAAPAEKAADPAEKAKADQMALREQQRGQQWAASATLGTDNEADKLGPSGKRRASRALLGG
jgi:hypothetical protein